MTKYLIENSDGSVFVMRLLVDGVKVEDEIKKWPAHMQAAVVGWSEIADEDVPDDRYFRAAWRADSGSISVDMEKALEIHRDELRRRRAPLLRALDVDYQKADEVGDTELKQEIARKKQALRDVTVDEALLAAKTPDDLKAVVPSILVDRV
jgi:hypothetical protein